MVGERGLEIIHWLSGAIIPNGTGLGKKLQIENQQPLGQKSPRVKFQEILSWKCPSAFLDRILWVEIK